tara:strand:- start:1516 stop:2427 length:912 start_codon:yes stop_codon:yes gene_type:complete
MADDGAEIKIRNILKKIKTFQLNSSKYEIVQLSKPTVSGGGGETKTDIYIRAKNKSNNKEEEIKISYKKPSFSFVENKIKSNRAKAIYGNNWSKIIQEQINEIKDNFLAKPLVYFEKNGRIEKGSITLGWRYEMEHSGSRSLGVKIKQDIAAQVWENKGAQAQYKDGIVDGKEIPLSGMPNFCLTIDPEDINTPDDIFGNLVSMKELILTHGDITAAFLAQNYRSHKQKQEGNRRHLGVWIEWKILNGKLACEYVFDKPLEMESLPRLENLDECLREIGIDLRKNFKIDLLKDKIHESVPVYP